MEDKEARSQNRVPRIFTNSSYDVPGYTLPDKLIWSSINEPITAETAKLVYKSSDNNLKHGI